MQLGQGGNQPNIQNPIPNDRGFGIYLSDDIAIVVDLLRPVVL